MNTIVKPCIMSTSLRVSCTYERTQVLPLCVVLYTSIMNKVYIVKCTPVSGYNRKDL